MNAALQKPENAPSLLGEGLESIAISVIIPARNEEKTIGQCLESLTRINFPAEDFEVIVVDNGSTDGTEEIANSFSGRLPLTVLKKKDGNISAVRNWGARAARGRVLAFTDADCVVPSDWLSRAGELFTSPRVGIIGAHGLIPENSSWVAKNWYRDVATAKRGEVSYVPTLDLLVKRSVLFDVGGFDEALETNEDYEFCQRVRAAGFAVVGIPEMGVVHLGTPQSLTAFYKKQRWHGTHVFRVFLRDISAFHNVRAVFFAVYTLLCLAGVILGAVRFIWTGHYLLLALSVGALFLAPFLLSIRIALRRRNGRDLPVLTILHLAYGVARAICLLEVKKWWGSWRRRNDRVPEATGASTATVKAPSVGK